MRMSVGRISKDTNAGLTLSNAKPNVSALVTAGAAGGRRRPTSALRDD